MCTADRLRPRPRRDRGRIVDLGLHLTVAPELGDEVVVALRATTGELPPALEE